tara:strand:- start:237 stop:434 length:198 start_codon:yes stop_codon:yes gene_type:complete
MKVGDIVIFNNKNYRTYGKTFYGALGRVEKVCLNSIRVRWCHAIDYGGWKPTISHFSKECFEVLK